MAVVGGPAVHRIQEVATELFPQTYTGHGQTSDRHDDSGILDGGLAYRGRLVPVLDNLRGNIEANFPVSQSVSVSACTLDWSRFPSAETDFPPLDEPFDLILGADLIYEAEHARWIQGCVAKLLRKPNRRKGTNDTDPGLPPAQFHLVIPLRPTHVMECNEVEVVFPLIETLQQSADCPRAEPTLAVLSKEVITCETHGGVRTRNGAGDEVEYAHYIIGWCV